MWLLPVSPTGTESIGPQKVTEDKSAVLQVTGNMRTLEFFSVNLVGSKIHCNVVTVSYDSGGAELPFVSLRRCVAAQGARSRQHWKGLTVIELVALTRRLSDSVSSLEVFLATVMLGFFQVEASTSLQRRVASDHVAVLLSIPTVRSTV